MSKEADARRARRERVAAMSAEEKRELAERSLERRAATAEPDDDGFIHDPILADLMDAFIETMKPAADDPLVRPLLREARSIRRTIVRR